MRTETYMGQDSAQSGYRNRLDLRPVHASESSQISSGLTSNERMRAQESRKVRVNGVWDSELSKIRAGIRNEEVLQKSKVNPKDLFPEDQPKRTLIKKLGDYVTKAKEGVSNFFVKTAERIRTILGKKKRMYKESQDLLQKSSKPQLLKRNNIRRVPSEIPIPLKKAQAGISSREINRPKSRIEPVAPKTHSARRVNAEPNTNVDSLPQTAKLQPIKEASEPKQEPKPEKKGELLNTKQLNKLDLQKPKQEPKIEDKPTAQNIASPSRSETQISPTLNRPDLQPIRLYRVNLPPKKVEEIAKETAKEAPEKVEKVLDQAPIKSHRKNKRTLRPMTLHRVNLPRKTVEATPETVKAVPEIVEKTLEKPVAFRPTRPEKKQQIRRSNRFVRRTAMVLGAGIVLSPTVGSKIDTYTDSSRNTGGNHLVIGDTQRPESRPDTTQKAHVSLDTNSKRATVTIPNIEQKSPPRESKKPVLQVPVEQAPSVQRVAPPVVESAPIAEPTSVPQTSSAPEAAPLAEVPPAPTPEVAPEPSTEAGRLVKQILDHPNISIETAPNDNDRIRRSIEAIQNDGKTFLYDVDNPVDTPVDPGVLRLVLELAKNGIDDNVGLQVIIGSLSTSREHAANSTHYSGKGIDLEFISEADFRAAFAFLHVNKDTLGLDELIYGRMLPEGTRNLAGGNPYDYSKNTLKPHEGHIHVSIK